MQSLDKSLPLLEQLKELVDQYDPIKYESSDDAKALAENIPQLYGAVQEVYRKYSGDLKVEVPDRGTTYTYYNYFEAGYLSGRTIHAHQGRQELLKVIGRVRSEAEQGESKEVDHHDYTGVSQNDYRSGSLEGAVLNEQKQSLKERFENHPLVFGFTLVIVSFLAGFGFNEWTMGFRGGESAASDLSGVAAQIESLTKEHNKRLEALHVELRENEKQAVYGGNSDSTQKKYAEAAQRLRGSIEEENNSYQMDLEQLIKIVNANDT